VAGAARLGPWAIILGLILLLQGDSVPKNHDSTVIGDTASSQDVLSENSVETAPGGSGKIPPPPSSSDIVADMPDDPDSKRVLQNGGRTINDSTAKALNQKFDENLTSREWGRKLEKLKNFEKNSNDSHGRIMGNGDYYTPNGDYVGNIGDW
jgi:hypothetical protein